MPTTPKQSPITPSSELQKQRRIPRLPQAAPIQITPQGSTLTRTLDAEAQALSATDSRARRATPWHHILQEKRLAYPLTQEQLAERAQIDWRHLQKIEAGTCNATLATWEKLATALDMPLGVLLTAPATPSTIEKSIAQNTQTEDTDEEKSEKKVQSYRDEETSIENDAAFQQENVDEIEQHVGMRIRELRQKQSISQQELAQRANVSLSSIQNAESARKSMTLRSLASLAVALRVPIQSLFE